MDLWAGFDALFTPLPSPSTPQPNHPIQVDNFLLRVAQCLIHHLLKFHLYDALPLVYQKEFCCAQRNSTLHCILLPKQFHQYILPVLKSLNEQYNDEEWLEVFQKLHLSTILECHMHPIHLLDGQQSNEMLCFTWRMRFSEYTTYIASPSTISHHTPKEYPLQAYCFRKSRRPYITHQTSTSARNRIVSFLIKTRFTLDEQSYPLEQSHELSIYDHNYSDSIMSTSPLEDVIAQPLVLRDGHVHVPYDVFMLLCSKAGINDLCLEETL